MPNGFGAGFERGRQVSGENPVTMILKGARDAYARRRSEDKKRDEEEQTLLHTLIQLGAKHEYDRTLAREERKAEAVSVEEERAFEKVEARRKRMGELQKEKLKGREERKTLLFKKKEGLEEPTQAKRKIIGMIRQLKAKNASLEDIEEAVSFEGYNLSDFEDELSGYSSKTPSIVSGFSRLIQRAGGGLF